MKFCQYCGTPLVDDANYCSFCGKETPQPFEKTSTNKEQNLVKTLSSRLETLGVIWLVIAIIQIIMGVFGIIMGVFGTWFTLIVGVLNIIYALTVLERSKRILLNQNGLVKIYSPITGYITTLVYNVLLGGVIGVVGSIYDFIFVRGFVMKNKDKFLAMET